MRSSYIAILITLCLGLAFVAQWYPHALIAEAVVGVVGLVLVFAMPRPSPPAQVGVYYHLPDPTPQEVKGLTHVLEWDPDDYWALQETAGDGRWTHSLSGDRASMERRLDHQKSSLAGQLSNFRAQQTPLPEGGPAWEKWERRIERFSQVDYRLVPDRRWRRHSLGVEPALEQIKRRLRMPPDKVRIRPLEDPERDELMKA